jgi:MFS family permease
MSDVDADSLPVETSDGSGSTAVTFSDFASERNSSVVSDQKQTRARVRHRVLGFLALLSIITYMDRVCISVSAPRIKEEFGISPAGWGWVMGVFTLAYGAFEIPSGAYGDRFGERRMLTRIVAWWSAFTVLTGMTSNFLGLIVTRFLFGVGEAGAYPNATGSIRRWFPPDERARAQGIVWGSSRIGGALTPVIVVPLLLAFGWRFVFYLFGAIGFAWAGFWWVWYRDNPAEHAAVTPEELTEIGPVDPFGSHHDIPWQRLVQCKQLWLIMVMYASYAWGSTFYIAWLPEFLIKGRSLSEQQMAFFAALPFAMGAIGNLVGGILSDRWTRRFGPKIGRVALGSACLFVSSLLLFCTSVCRSNQLAIVLLALGFGVMDCMLPCAWAICLDIGGKHAGAVSGAMNTAGQAGGFACSVLFGYLVGWYGNYNVPLVVIATMVLVSAFLFAQINPSQPLELDDHVPVTKEAKCV